MRILLVSEDIPAPKLGGLGKHVVALGNALIAMGHEVFLMGKDSPDYAACATEVGFHGRFVPGLGIPLRGWKEEQLGFFNPLKRPYFAKRMAKAIVNHAAEYDVVHYHGHQPMVARYIPASLNFVQTRHDQGGDCITNVRFKNGDVCTDRSPDKCAACIHPAPGPLRTVLSSMAVSRYRRETALAYAAHPVVFVSDFLRKNYLQTMPDADLRGSAVIHNFVDEKLLVGVVSPASGQGISPSVVLHVAGRLDEPKGVGQLLDLLIPRLPSDWHVNVYGDGPLRKAIENRHSSPSLHLHGHQLHVDVVSATKAATLVVVPSVLEEACGTVILEALRLGKMCFSLDRGGTPELTRYGSPGQLRLFPDLEALVAGLLSENDFTVDHGGSPADVRQHIEELLPIYQRKHHGS